MSGFAARLLRDMRAVAAVEFALIASVLMLLLLGLCDVAPTFLAYTHVGTSASTSADVTAQFSQMQASDMVSVYSAANDVMAPFSATNQSIRITNVFSDGNGNAKVYWSCGNGTLPPYQALSRVTSTPTGGSFTGFLYLYNVYVGVTLNGTNTSYVVSEVSYNYTAPAQFLLKSALNLSGVSYFLPRASAYVGFPWNGNSNSSATVPTAATRANSMSLSNGATCSYAS